jgi:hypothetical protein
VPRRRGDRNEGLVKKSEISVIIFLVVGAWVAFSNLEAIVDFGLNMTLGMVSRVEYLIVGDSAIPESCEIVMPPNSTITATTKTGTIIIQSGKGLKRFYTWDGVTRSVAMTPRSERWYGSLGMYDPGAGCNWMPKHNGISRGVLEEGRQHFKSIDAALDWIKTQAGYYPIVYRDDGLLVGFGKNLSREQINVDVWQILVGGKKPKMLPGSCNYLIKTSW